MERPGEGPLEPVAEGLPVPWHAAESRARYFSLIFTLVLPFTGGEGERERDPRQAGVAPGGGPEGPALGRPTASILPHRQGQLQGKVGLPLSLWPSVKSSLPPPPRGGQRQPCSRPLREGHEPQGPASGDGSMPLPPPPPH